MNGNQAKEIDIEFLTFVERYATNLMRWDVLVFFGENPTAREYANGIANKTGRQVHPVEKELNDLVYLGVLHSQKNSNGMIYHLADAPAIRRAVVNLARCCNSTT
ncbi:MAG: hypothetical protein HY257_03390 [Chloroflexi bacterium]|nr:hypothetical protein [Chloroflexota bacterium]